VGVEYLCLRKLTWSEGIAYDTAATTKRNYDDDYSKVQWRHHNLCSPRPVSATENNRHCSSTTHNYFTTSRLVCNVEQ